MFAGIVYTLGGIISALIGLRFIFRLLGANPDSAFVSGIYDWSTPFVAPFAGIFVQEATVISELGTVTASVFDWTALIALIVYGIVFSLIGRLLATRRVARP